MSDEIERQLAERRADTAFTERLAKRMDEDRMLLHRIAGDECKAARLVESRDGGAVLIYECECGALLFRTREQAEADARPENADKPAPWNGPDYCDHPTCEWEVGHLPHSIHSDTLPSENANTRIECIHCGVKQTHRVCADCFTRRRPVDSDAP